MKKTVIRQAEYNADLNQQQNIRHQKEVMTKFRSFNRKKYSEGQNRKKPLEKIEFLYNPLSSQTTMRLHLKPKIISVNNVLRFVKILLHFFSV